MPVTTRESSEFQVTIPANDSLSRAVDFRGYVSGGFKSVTFDSGTVMGFKVSEDITGNYIPLRDTSNALVTVTVSGVNAYPLPTGLTGWPWFKYWTESGGADKNQTNERILITVLES